MRAPVVRLALAALGAAFVALGIACSSSSSESPSPADADAGADAADASLGKRVAPELYDCRAPGPPARTSKVPPSCATDPSCKERLVSAHRGAGGDLGVIAPENTVSATRAAIALGVDFVETDPRPSKDGVIVNVHDTDVSRVAEGTGNVADMTLAELRALKLKTTKFQGDFGCERIATLEEILGAARGRVHVLVDANKTDQVDKLVAAIVATDTLDWAIFDTSALDKIERAIAIEPRLKTMIRVETEAQLSDALGRFAAHPPVLVEINGNGTPEALVGPIHAAKHRALFDVFGVDVAVRFVPDLGQYQKVYDKGVDVVQTDRPDLVLALLGR